MAVLDAGHRVIGIEGGVTPVQAFFSENKIAYEVENDASNQCEVYKVDSQQSRVRYLLIISLLRVSIVLLRFIVLTFLRSTSKNRIIIPYCDFNCMFRDLPPVDYIWDRGGLVAVTPATREQ